MTERDFARRELAWIYLRHVIEGSRADVLDLLWPKGWEVRRLNKDPADVERVARMIVMRDRALPHSVRVTTEHRCSYDPRGTMEYARREGLRLLTPDSPQWPTELTDAFLRMKGSGADNEAGVRGQAEAPFALWLRGSGNLAQLTERSLTVVGTRAATRYGRNVAYQFSRELGEQGYTLVSGGAEGIDKQAHLAAVEGGTPTVVLLAGGVDVSYPAKHQELFQRIAQTGSLLVSEYAPGTRPARHRFLTRNRLAAALGLATLMVEAPVRSGAINTMNWAEAMLKPTLAVPGPVDAAASQGGLLRIQQGRAALIRTSKDVLEHVEPVGQQMELDVELDGEKSSTLSWQETAVFDAAGVRTDGTGSLSQIQADTGLSAEVVIRIVRDLEFRGLLVREGDRWIKARGRQGEEL